MKYSNAESILPEELLRTIQEYVQGELIYIPKPKEAHLKWGEKTHSKSRVSARNAEIQSLFRNGLSIEELASQYFLSYESIKKIVYKKN
ncbi:Mor family transcriptional regulator [Paenibacillus sp. JGP012]|uniref:CD3324 family protein n=1 Tax=Paenibacillus sp. JGP012 TaxID=2735914 RepID=UPI001610CDB2|nr:CD3324 family protein [Paenibacillus sp. JGP012]MBB6020256.1 Mor family transcriptional regulator [Paenibacillus sp. JGP012]